MAPMPLTPREELLKLQRQIYRNNQKIINDSILVQESNFKKYEQTYRKAIRRYQSVSTAEEMLKVVRHADIIYVGDYHTCHQSQRSFLRILKAVIKKDSDFIIALELIHHRYQKILERFLAGKISEETFLKKVGLKKHWVFDLWDNFKPIFHFASYHHIPILGINGAGKNASLQERDKAAAKILAKVSQNSSGKKIFVLIGDLHLAPKHLPAEVKAVCKQLKIERKECILYQNSEPIYWDLAESGLEDKTEVVKIADREFCRMNTPPVMCQRSYLNWLEHEEGEIDYFDARQSFLDLLDRICLFLKIDLGKTKERVEIFTAGDLSFLDKVKESGQFTLEEIREIKKQILASESYYISKMRYVYLANLSVNHAAEEAAHCIKHLCSGNEKAREPGDAFYANILHEALGFFGSKIANHKRKCFHAKEFEKHLRYFDSIKIPKNRRLEY